MASAAQDILEILVDDVTVTGITALGTDAFVEVIPDGIGIQDNLSGVFAFPGQADQDRQTMGGGVAFEKPSIQVQTRHTKLQDAMNEAYEIYAALNGLTNTIKNGTEYTFIRCIKYPQQLLRDDQDRYIWISEYSIERRPEGDDGT